MARPEARPRDESMQQLLDLLNEARGTLMEAAKAIAVDEQYGTLTVSDDGWDRDLYEAMLSSSDNSVQAGFMALAVAHYIHHLARKLELWQEDLEEKLDEDTDVKLAHKQGVMVTIESAHTLLGESDPMKLYEAYMNTLGRINRSAD